jgi:cytochrome c556
MLTNVLFAVLLVTSFALPAAGQTSPPIRAEDAIKYRQATFVVQMHVLRKLVDANKAGRKPSEPELQELVKTLELTSKLPWEAFATGTQGGKATPAVWSDHAKWRQSIDSFQRATSALQSAASGGESSTFTKALGAVSQSCKSCHDTFRQ